MSIKFSVNVSPELLAGTNWLAKKAENPKDLLRDIGEVIVEDIKNRIISTKKDINDVPFKAWAPSTKKARERDGSAALGILHNTGALAMSINYKVTGRNFLHVGSTSPYAPFLNNGTPKMTAREFMGVSQRAREGMNEVLAQYFGDHK